MQARSKFMTAAAIFGSLGLLALSSQFSVRVALPPADASPPPLSTGMVVWFVALISLALIGLTTVCVFTWRLLRRLLRPTPLP